MAEDFPQVEASARLATQRLHVRHGDRGFVRTLTVADPAILDVFTIRLESGELGALRDPSKVLLSRSTSEELFGDEDPIGQRLDLPG